MSNSFYNHGAFPSTGSAATSASMRAELDLVAAGFDKMPTLAGNANKFIVVNSTGTGLTQTDVLPAFTVTDTDFTVQDDGDNTRKFKFNAGSITTGNTRTYVMPDLDTTLVGTNVTQTLTNKTLTAPVIATIVNTGTLTLPTSTDTLVGRNTTDTLTNKTLTNPVIGTIVNTGTLTLPTATDTLVGRQTTDTLTNKTISGASNTLSNIANGSLSNSSVVIGSTTLSLGGTMTTLAGVTISGASNTLSNIANASLTNSSITINGSTVALGSSVTVTATATNALTIGNGLSGTSYNGSSAVTIAINTGVTADLSTAQTFSNKTISGSANTLTNIANASLTNSAITIGSTAISLGATSLTLAGLTSASATTLISTGNQATSVAISAIGHSSGTVTVTTGTAHGLTTGDVASIDGVADYTFCGVYTVTVTNANVFTYSQTASGASSSGGFSTKLTGTWGLYAGGTGPSLANGPVMINASSQMPALRVTQGGSGYALIVEDAANPDTSAFIISNAGDLAINTNKFTVAAASGNTVIAGTTSLNGNVTFATDATYDIGATGANRPRDLFLSRNLVVGGTLTLAGGVNLNGNVTIGDASSDTLTINSTITSNLIFTDNTYDIGASGATRPKNLYLAGLLTMGGALTVAGASNLNGAVTLGDAAADNITVNGTITSNLIFTDNTYDIGALGATRPRNVYLSGTTITQTNSSSVSNVIQSTGGGANLRISAATGAGAFANQITFDSSGTIKWALGGGNVGSGGANDFGMYDYANAKLTYLVLAASGNMLMNTNLLFVDNTFDIGASGVTRPRNLYLAGAASVDLGAVINETGGDYDFRVESDNRPHMLFVDAGTDQVMMGQSTPRTNATLTLSYWGNSAGNNAQLSIDANTNSGTGQAVVDLLAGSGSTNRASRINFLNGVASTTTPRWTLINDYDQSGINDLRLVNAATWSMMEFTQSGGVVFNEGSNDLDFRVESDTNAYALFVDAGNSTVGINTSASTAGVDLVVSDVVRITGAAPELRVDVGSAGYYLQLTEEYIFPKAISHIRSVAGASYEGQLQFSANIGAGSYIQLALMDSTFGSVFNNSNLPDLDFRVASDTNSYMLWVDGSADGVNIGSSDTIQGQLNVMYAPGSDVASTSSIYITTGQQYGTAANKKNLDLVFQGYRDGAGSGNGVKARIRAVEQSGNNRLGLLQTDILDSSGNLQNISVMYSSDVIFNEDSRDMDFRIESDTNANAFFIDAGLGTVNINGTGPVNNADMAGFQNLSSNAVLSTVSIGASSFARIQNVAAVNNSTVDAFRFLDHGGAVFATSNLAGHFYVNVTGGSGVNQFAAVYAVMTTGNGFGFGDSLLTLVSSITRGTNPVSSVAIASDGAGGAVKLTITYINNSGVVTGGNSTVTFLGQTSNT
jgi:hypothetical protein